MAQPVIKTSFASGEWAPKLVGRVDIQKYHAGAALLRNFYVDYSGGGASTRPGTVFINQTREPTTQVRLIPFQPSSTLSYVLEFGAFYIRFFSNGAPILEGTTAITAITNANPGVITDTAHGYNNGDWVFLTGIGGMTQLNGNYFIVQNATANTFTLTDLVNIPIDTTTFGVYTSGGTAARVYSISSPYAGSDLTFNPITQNPGLKYVQNVNQLIITHPNYPPAVLTENAATNWTFSTISFLPTIATPTGVSVVSNLGAGTFNYGYLVTAVDANGQESNPSSVVTVSSLLNIQSSAGTNSVSWTAVPGAVSYNIYACSPTVTVAISSGAQFGFIGNVTGTSFTETTPGIARDFSQGPPIAPSSGAAVKSLTLTANATYTAVPSVTLAPPPAGITASANASLSVFAASPATLVLSSTDNLGNPVSANGIRLNLQRSVVVFVITSTPLGGSLWSVTSVAISNGGTLSGAGTAAPANLTPVGVFPPPGTANVVSYSSGSVAVNWHIGALVVTAGGSGYVTAPAVTFSPAGATATSSLGPTVGGISINPTASGNPGVCGFFQERLVLAAPPGAVQTYYMSQPGVFFNFSTSFPAQDTDAIQGSIIAEDLNDIRSLLSVPTGIIAFSGKGAWLINGGGGLSVSSPITPANQTASPQAFNGANDLKPIKINFDVLYVTNKGNYVRDLSYNLYAAIYTGADISVLSNHLFFNHYIYEWAWSEEPFKTLWAIRNDGILLSLAYVKEQELAGWAHHDTDGQFISTCSVIETTADGNVVDAVYFVTQRVINGFFVQYVERLADRFMPYGQEDAWCVDCGLRSQPIVSFTGNLFVVGDPGTVGNPVILVDNVDNPFFFSWAADNWIVRAGGGIYKMTSFTASNEVTAIVVQSPPNADLVTADEIEITNNWTIWQPNNLFTGMTQLAGTTVTGLGDGVVIPPTVVNADGSVNLPAFYTKVILGLPFTPQLQTLPLDLGEPTIQSKRKKLPALTLRVADTLGLQAGTSFANVVTMKDFQLGSIPTVSNGPAMVSGLYSGDGRTILDQVWQEPGQLCIQQNLPYPATILAVIPEVAVGDTPPEGGRRG
jgi:hypothetical protein